jgi:hypothetical protein
MMMMSTSHNEVDDNAETDDSSGTEMLRSVTFRQRWPCQWRGVQLSNDDDSSASSSGLARLGVLICALVFDA